MATKKEKTLSDLIAEDIGKVAGDLEIPAYALTKATYFSEASFSEWDVRKIGGFINVRNTYFEQKEKKDHAEVYSNSELRRKLRKTQREAGDLEFLMRRIEKAISKMPPIKVRPYKPKKHQGKKKEPRTLNAIMSDLHLGSDLELEQHECVFGPIEEARAVAYYVKNLCTYKLEYRDQTELVLNILGGVIENSLHGVHSQDVLHIQTCRAIHVLEQAVARLSENFPKVIVNFSVGNHGRDMSVHTKRATDNKYNAIETTIYYAVKKACKGLKNVEFNQPLTPWISYKAQGHWMYGTHGDTHLTPGNVGTKIDIKQLENQTNKINAALHDKKEYKVFMCAHVHQGVATPLPNGAFLIVNGAMVPPNSFAQTLNIMESQQVQIIFETTPEYPVGDIRFVNVGRSAKDKSLDLIIKPFEGLGTF